MVTPRIPARIGALAALVVIAGWSRPAVGQGANDLLLTGNTVRITIDQVDAQGNLLPASSQKARLLWGKRSETSKITVSMVRFGPDLRLTVEAIRAQNATPVGTVELTPGMPEMDFVVGIRRGRHGSARLLYTADASTWSGGIAGAGVVDHIVTYTVTAQ